MADQYLDYAIKTRAGLAKLDPSKEWSLLECGLGWCLYGVEMSAWRFELLVRRPDAQTDGAGVIGEYRLYQPSGDLLSLRRMGRTPDGVERFERRAYRRALAELQARDRGRTRDKRTGFFTE